MRNATFEGLMADEARARGAMVGEVWDHESGAWRAVSEMPMEMVMRPLAPGRSIDDGQVLLDENGEPV